MPLLEAPVWVPANISRLSFLFSEVLPSANHVLAATDEMAAIFIKVRRETGSITQTSSIELALNAGCASGDSDRMPQPCIERELLGQFQHLPANTRKRLRVGALVQSLADPFADDPHFRFLHAARGERRRADADT